MTMFESDSPKPKRVSTPSKVKTARIIVLGEKGVGKTALIVRCLTKRFLPEYISRRDSSDIFRTNHEGDTLNLELVDFNIKEGGEIANGDGFVLVYSVSSRNSLRKLSERIELIQRAYGNDVPIAIVGNKRDLTHFRNVSTVEGIEFASENKAAFFCELSVATDVELIPQVFIEMFKIIDLKRKSGLDQRRGKQKVSKMLNNIKDIVKRTNSR